MRPTGSDILVVDDEADIRDLVSGLLEDEGHAVRVAANSDEALAAIRARTARPLVAIGGIHAGNAAAVLAAGADGLAVVSALCAAADPAAAARLLRARMG